jgi:uncharacterized membrane protein
MYTININRIYIYKGMYKLIPLVMLYLLYVILVFVIVFKPFICRGVYTATLLYSLSYKNM